MQLEFDKKKNHQTKVLMENLKCMYIFVGDFVIVCSPIFAVGALQSPQVIPCCVK